jgi:hypothetical protein
LNGAEVLIAWGLIGTPLLLMQETVRMNLRSLA